MRLIYFLITIFFTCESCKPYTALRKMNSEEAVFEQWKNESNKTVVFLPMIHAGKPEFYKNVHQKITSLKNAGYVVFYEGVKSGFISDSALIPGTIKKYQRYPEVQTLNVDSLKKLIYVIKLKRMVGISPDSATYANFIKRLPILKKSVAQPSASYLGVSNSDFNIDVTGNELVDIYEQAFGEITLEQIDFAVPLNQPLPRFRILKQKNIRPIIIDYRNDHLANSIQNSEYDKILVIYGLAHKKGTFNNLKILDPTWKVLK